MELEVQLSYMNPDIPYGVFVMFMESNHRNGKSNTSTSGITARNLDGIVSVLADAKLMQYFQHAFKNNGHITSFRYCSCNFEERGYFIVF